LNLIIPPDVSNLFVQIIEEHLSIGSGAEQEGLSGAGTDIIVF
jgi:hypothetical protein